MHPHPLLVSGVQFVCADGDGRAAHQTVGRSTGRRRGWAGGWVGADAAAVETEDLVDDDEEDEVGILGERTWTGKELMRALDRRVVDNEDLVERGNPAFHRTGLWRRRSPAGLAVGVEAVEAGGGQFGTVVALGCWLDIARRRCRQWVGGHWNWKFGRAGHVPIVKTVVKIEGVVARHHRSGLGRPRRARGEQVLIEDARRRDGVVSRAIVAHVEPEFWPENRRDIVVQRKGLVRD